jgi:BMFP domain-containing protein YqiC
MGRNVLHRVFKSSKVAYKARRRTIMAQTDNPFLDGVARAFTDAAGMAQGVRAEIDTFVRQRLERLVADMDFVPREEFDAVKAMAAKAREENDALAARLAVLEGKQG